MHLATGILHENDWGWKRAFGIHGPADKLRDIIFKIGKLKQRV